MDISDASPLPDKKKEADDSVGSYATHISAGEVKEALLRSGYLLEHRVEIFLRKRGWYVEANSAYHDPDTNKSRELDIYALRLFEYDAKSGDAIFGSVIAECVNNPQPVAFITKEDKYMAFEDDIKLVIDPREVNNEKTGEKVPVATFLELSSVHHYCKGRIATQFCSFTKKKDKENRKNEWMALHETNHFESLMTLVKALEYKNGAFDHVEGNDLRTELMYPVLVLQGQLLDVRLSGDEIEVISVDHLKYRRSVIWGGVETGYIIDVVTEKGLKEFENLISEEIGQIADKIHLQSDVLRRNIVHKPRIEEKL